MVFIHDFTFLGTNTKSVRKKINNILIDESDTSLAGKQEQTADYLIFFFIFFPFHTLFNNSKKENYIILLILIVNMIQQQADRGRERKNMEIEKDVESRCGGVMSLWLHLALALRQLCCLNKSHFFSL